MNHNSQEAADRFSRMMTKADAKLNEVYGGRADLYISDVQPLDRDSCYALVNYAQGLPSPTSEAVVEFIGAKFSGKVRPVLETAKAFVDHNAVLVMLAKYQPTRRIDDVAQMHTVIAGARYLDVEMKDTWDVAVTPEGTKYLRRVNDDDVSKMVAERRARMTVTAGVTELTVAKALGSGASTAETGDIVRLYHQGSIYSDCEVKNVQADNRLSVKIPNVGTFTVAREAIVEVQAISKGKAGAMKSKLAEYYKKALPDSGYAKDLTRELIDEGTDALPNSHWPKPGSVGDKS
jgi:hypothetical protein